MELSNYLSYAALHHTLHSANPKRVELLPGGASSRTKCRREPTSFLEQTSQRVSEASKDLRFFSELRSSKITNAKRLHGSRKQANLGQEATFFYNSAL